MRFEGGEGAYTIGAAVSLAFVVALTPFHPQYVLWALPFVVPTLAQRPFGTLLAASQVLLFVVWLSRWGASVTTELLLPLGRDIVQQLPDPQLVASALIPAAVWQPVRRGDARHGLAHRRGGTPAAERVGRGDRRARPE